MFCNFLVTTFNLHENSYLKWLQLVDSIPERWKFIIKENCENASNMIIHDHHLIKGSRDNFR